VVVMRWCYGGESEYGGDGKRSMEGGDEGRVVVVVEVDVEVGSGVVTGVVAGVIAGGIIIEEEPGRYSSMVAGLGVGGEMVVLW